ncbi:ABC transporter permease [Erysipelothrix sp. HDW6C]|uniref:ABC transporter permease n=1 Tax=Erysipelothrix sp. HDW6C TaxID=2714930 RepID=UPI00140A85C5|nr:ABC transporter permease [Erysipelothrix sp. HDW6C]QIK69728.1 ABC transporter permease [Erysipelothrix sp. HDW6C]
MKLLRKVYPLATIIILWYLASLLVGVKIIPYPHQAFAMLIKNANELLIHASASLYRILLAIFFSFLIGVPVGIALGINHKFDALISPLVYILYPLPKIAFLPVFMQLFGLGDSSKIILMITILVFQVIISTRDGIRLIPNSYIMLMDSYHANRRHRLRYLYFPAIMPQLLSGLRIGLGVAIATLFFSENYATFTGLGYFIMNAWTTFNYPLMFAGIIVLSLMGYILFKIVDYLEVKITH